MALWPFVRQYRLANKESFDSDPKILEVQKWLSNYMNNPIYDYVMQKYKQWEIGDNPNRFGYN